MFKSFAVLFTRPASVARKAYTKYPMTTQERKWGRNIIVWQVFASFFEYSWEIMMASATGMTTPRTMKIVLYTSVLRSIVSK